MKVLLTALGAKYIHTNLAVRQLEGYAAGRVKSGLSILEGTVNHQPEDLLADIYRAGCDVVCFSCYIWNIQLVLRLARELRQVRPDTIVVLGGPEVSFSASELLEAHPYVDYILCGEGELSFTALVETLESGAPVEHIPGLCRRIGEQIVQGPAPEPLDLDLLPFPYPDLERYPHQILYYEASRGCPFFCQYCLSASEKPVRLRSLPLVLGDLDRFLAAGVRQVKFVDRTFNADKDFAKQVWRHLIEHDNGVTNFHFEIAANCLDKESAELLAKARPGYFQMEIGVQSTNGETLKAIRRGSANHEIAHWVARLKEARNIHLHLDLIAGLPHEDFSSFRRSFDQVFAMGPDQLQLGFLKLLKGSGLRRDAGQYGIVFRDDAPYEVLYTWDLPYSNMLRLKLVEEAVEYFQNSGRFAETLRYMLAQCDSPFDFYLELGAYLHQSGLSVAALGKDTAFTALRDFWTGKNGPDNWLLWLCRYDIMRHERPRKFPSWARVDYSREYRDRVAALLEEPGFVQTHLPHLAGLSPREILQHCHVELYPVDPRSCTEQETLFVFDYRSRGLDGQARTIAIPL